MGTPSYNVDERDSFMLICMGGRKKRQIFKSRGTSNLKQLG